MHRRRRRGCDLQLGLGCRANKQSFFTNHHLTLIGLIDTVGVDVVWLVVFMSVAKDLNVFIV